MARTAAGAELTQRHRAAQLVIRAAGLGALLRLWRTVDPTDLSRTIGPFAAGAAALVLAQRDRSAARAAAYFAAFRAAEVGGRRQAVGDVAPDVGTVAALIRGAALSGIITARRAGKTADTAARTGLVKTSGQASSLILGGGRDVLTGSASADPQATKWIRITASDPCAFCRMVASRGAAYYSAATAGFEPHGSCSCQPEPHYPGSRLPPASRRFEAEWIAAQREATELGDTGDTSNDALNAYRRWLQRHTAPPADA